MVTLDECKAFVRQCQLDVPDQMLGVVFAESLMTVMDTMANKDKLKCLNHPEFIYFLCRITDVHYTNTVYEQDEFYIKLDNLLPDLLDPFDLVPQYRMSANFSPKSYESKTLGQQKLFLSDLEYG